jgi:hypothetical protein
MTALFIQSLLSIITRLDRKLSKRFVSFTVN